MAKAQVKDDVDVGDEWVDNREKVTEQRKAVRKRVVKESCSRKKDEVEEPFHSCIQPNNDDDSNTIIDSGDLYMETEQSMEVADEADGLVRVLNEKPEKDVAGCTGGAPSGRQKELNGVLKLRRKLESSRTRVATRVKGRGEKEVQSSRISEVGSETWKKFEYEETILRELYRKAEELTEEGSSVYERNGIGNEGVDKTSLDSNGDTTMEEEEEANGEGKRIRWLLRGRKSRDRTQNIATKSPKFSQKLSTKTGRTETILVVPNYQRETTETLDSSSIQNSIEKYAEPDDSSQTATAHVALKKTAQRKIDKAFDNKSVKICNSLIIDHFYDTVSLNVPNNEWMGICRLSYTAHAFGGVQYV